ncbi:MAG TPA: hypothetical protein VLD37_04280 [Candidatus Bilamarchaeum sp.]|nr:hypothetical protein [Candidatus Bilamarchaeum sp.]
MKKGLLLLLILALSFAQSAAEQQFQQSTQSSGLEIAQNWQALALMGIFISIIIVAIAYMLGRGFEMPEITAWASTELVQVIVNAIIVASLMGVIAFIELTVIGIAASSNINAPGCYGTAGNATSCLQDVTNFYLNDYATTAADGAKGVLKQNMDAAGMAGRRIGLYCLTIYCLQVGTTTTIAGHYILKSDMYAIVFEYYTNLLSTIEAQRFFVREICFKMGPVILAIGIVARTFFFTRKLGGLLMAIAVGVMFFFPGMYIFDWVTLDFALTGDKGLEDEVRSCPDECGALPPLAYLDNGDGLITNTQVYSAFSDADKNTAKGIISGSIASATASTTNTSNPAYGKVVTSCYGGDWKNCPSSCRELPYPTSPECVNYTTGVQATCASVPEACKVKRIVQNINTVEYDSCPASCKVVPPLKSDCNTGACLQSSLDCRVAHTDDLNWRPTKSFDEDNAKSVEKAVRCSLASQCPASLTAEQSCTYVIPVTGRCSDLCGACPSECRIDTLATTAAADLPASCKDPNTGAYWAACLTCPEGCKVRNSQLQELDAAADGNNTCGSCPVTNRLIAPTLPLDYTTGGCGLDQCPSDFRGVVPRNSCEMCLFTQESYAYSPPINTQCGDICRPSDNTPATDPSQFSKIGESGLVGLPEIQSVSKLMVPAYVLPLFNIVTTLVFIKGLSGFLGGDIEIPGLSKVF